MKLMFVGDLNLGEYYTAFGHGPKSYAQKGQRSVFEHVQGIFDRADFVVGNLEAPITTCNDNPAEPECCVLKAHPDTAHQLQDSGFKVVQVANNHIVQHTKEGFAQTLDILDEMDVLAAGVNNQDPVTLELENKTFAFFAASDVPDNTDKQQAQYQRLDEDFVKKVEGSIARYDHVIVMLHWGLEESTVPLAYQRELAARLKKAGVRAIIGSHPHLFYEIECDSDFVCAYSLGNFVFDLCWDPRLMMSGILEIDFSSEELSCKLWPVTLESSGSAPTPSGNPVDLPRGSYVHYDLGESLNWWQTKKTIHFWLNICRGDTALKIRFFTTKIRRVLEKVTGMKLAN